MKDVQAISKLGREECTGASYISSRIENTAIACEGKSEACMPRCC